MWKLHSLWLNMHPSYIDVMMINDECQYNQRKRIIHYVYPYFSIIIIIIIMSYHNHHYHCHMQPIKWFSVCVTVLFFFIFLKYKYILYWSRYLVECGLEQTFSWFAFPSMAVLLVTFLLPVSLWAGHFLLWIFEICGVLSCCCLQLFSAVQTQVPV